MVYIHDSGDKICLAIYRKGKNKLAGAKCSWTRQQKWVVGDNEGKTQSRRRGK
jgi:hypothetical protein